jgi:prolyl-tRNA synthetase
MQDGKALQAGTSHFLGQNFAKASGIQFQNRDGKQEFGWTTSWGMTTRMIGAVIMTHGDDKGLILPPRLAPYQVVVVPIGRGEEAAKVVAAARDLTDRLVAAGVRVHLDDRPQLSPGFKFNQWELQGVPVRLELGPRDLAAGQVVMARRLGEGKEEVPLSSVVESMPKVLDDFQDALLQRATEFRDSRTADVDRWEDFVAAVARGWARAFHCGRPECEDEINAETTATPRCVPLGGPEESGPCIRCGQASDYGKRVVFGRAY